MIVQLPDGRKITVQTNDPQVAATAGRRLLAREALHGGGKPRPGGGSSVASAAINFGDEMFLGAPKVLSGLIAGGLTGAKNLGLRAQGKEPTYGMNDAYVAQRGIDKDRLEAFQKSHPVLSGGSGLLGAFSMPGAGELAAFIKGPKEAKGLLAGLKQVTKGAGIGGALGTVSGATNADPGHEVEGAVQGGTAGTVIGGGIPIVGGGVKRGVKTARGAVDTLYRYANAKSGGTLLDPMREGMIKLTEALKRDGATPENMKAVLNEWMRTAPKGADPASNPTLLDLAGKLPSGGGNTIKLLTGAGMKGGVGAARQYADEVAGQLQPTAIKAAQALTPDTRPATVVADELKATQRGLASKQFKPAYETPLGPTSPEVTSALADDHGVAAIRQAISEASANRDYGSVKRLQALLKPAAAAPVARIGEDEVPLPQHILDKISEQMPKAAEDAGLNAGDLDRVRLNLNTRARNLMKGDNPKPGVAGGLFQRGTDLDAALGDIPELTPARATYKGMQGQRLALKEAGKAITALPDDYEAAMNKFLGMATGDVETPHPVMPEDIQGTAQVGHRQALTDAIGSPPENATGVLNKLSSGTNVGRNQDFDFGGESAQAFRDAVKNQIHKMNMARLIDPSFSARTAGRMDALADPNFTAPKIGLGHAVLHAVNKVLEGSTLTDHERDAIVKLGTSLQDPDFAHLVEPGTPILDSLNILGAYAPAAGGSMAGANVQNVQQGYEP